MSSALVPPASFAEAAERDEALIRERLEIYRAIIAGNLTEGFTQMPDQVREDPNLSRAAKLVYEQLLRYTRQKDCCWPSQQTIANNIVTISRRTVIRALKELFERGYIEVWRRGLNRTNVYYINPLSFAQSFKRPWRGRGTLVDAHGPEVLASVLNTPQPDVLTRLKMPVDPMSGKCQNDTSRSAKMTHPDAPIWHTKHTESKNTQNEPNTVNESKIRRGEAAKLEKGTDSASSTPTYSHIALRTIGNQQDTDANGTNEIEPIESSNPSNSQKTAGPAQAKDVKEDNKREKKRTLEELAAEMEIAPESLAALNAWMKENRRPETTPLKLQGIIPQWSRELGNGEPRLVAANITQASKLYKYARLNGVSQDATESCFESAREQVRLHSGVEKKMAYFFTSLKLEILMAIKRQEIPTWPAPQVPDGYEDGPAPAPQGNIPPPDDVSANAAPAAPAPAEPEAQAEAQEELRIVTNNPQLGWAKADSAQWWADRLCDELDPGRNKLFCRVHPTEHHRWGFVVRSQADAEAYWTFVTHVEVKACLRQHVLC